MDDGDDMRAGSLVAADPRPGGGLSDLQDESLRPPLLLGVLHQLHPAHMGFAVWLHLTDDPASDSSRGSAGECWNRVWDCSNFNSTLHMFL